MFHSFAGFNKGIVVFQVTGDTQFAGLFDCSTLGLYFSKNCGEHLPLGPSN